jgi:hypothetical protein
MKTETADYSTFRMAYEPSAVVFIAAIQMTVEDWAMSILWHTASAEP